MHTREEILDLLDYRREVAALYQQVRGHDSADERTWRRWIDGRDRLFREHPSSALPKEQHERFEGLPYFAHDPAMRTTGALEIENDGPSFEIGHSAGGTTSARRLGTLRFQLSGTTHRLSAYWLEQYAGGLFVPFRDATSGDTTYGGGRYLLDTAKSADLGTDDGRLILDFNYAYHPSCVHDARWSCPLAPPENVLEVAIRAGERLRDGR